MFEPFRCEDCVHGIYNPHDSCLEDGCGATDEIECKSMYEDDERM